MDERKKLLLIVFLVLGIISISMMFMVIQHWYSKNVPYTPLLEGNKAAQSTSTAVSPTQTATLTHQATAEIKTSTPTPTMEATVTPTLEPPDIPAILVGAGDISICGQDGDDQTADLLDQIPGIVFTAGDNSNENGSTEQYQDCFNPTWGRYISRMHPSAGNHDYDTENATDYFSYFGESAGEPGEGYYSYDAGDWHIIVLNSNCLSIDGCGPSSSQVAWLKEDLENHNRLCTLAYWHHPRWTSGYYGDADWLDTFWQVLYDYGVELVVNGHDHFYERLAPQDPEGNPDPEKGIRQIIAGTGGVGHDAFYELTKNSDVRNNGDFGVIKFSLFRDHYEWEFIPVAGGNFTDSGMDICH